MNPLIFMQQVNFKLSRDSKILLTLYMYLFIIQFLSQHKVFLKVFIHNSNMSYMNIPAQKAKKHRKYFAKRNRSTLMHTGKLCTPWSG